MPLLTTKANASASGFGFNNFVSTGPGLTLLGTFQPTNTSTFSYTVNFPSATYRSVLMSGPVFSTTSPTGLKTYIGTAGVFSNNALGYEIGGTASTTMYSNAINIMADTNVESAANTLYWSSVFTIISVSDNYSLRPVMGIYPMFSNNSPYSANFFAGEVSPANASPIADIRVELANGNAFGVGTQLSFYGIKVF